jgi:hypothetical protein
MMQATLRIGILLTGILVTGNLVLAQSSDRMTRAEYLETYKDMAVDEMLRSGVPASITLAQGALESGDGNSSLAKGANNHFGIKCHKDWSGKKIYQDDDARNECFRKYPSVEDSYHDHSDYLRAQSRYAFLFELDPADFKGWARGLKKAGYATSPTYAESLIRIIEEFGLQRYDQANGEARISRRRSGQAPGTSVSRTILEKNRVKYILALPGDTYESLTTELGKLSRELPGYNDAQAGDSLIPGRIVYIQPKRNKAGAGINTHILRPGETMHMVSQLYAIKLSSLYAMNLLVQGTEPGTGTTLQLRRAVRRPAAEQEKYDAPQGGEEEDEIKVEIDLD